MNMRYESYLYDDESSGYFPVLARAGEATASRYTRLNQAYATGTTGAIRKLVKTFAPGFFAGSGTSASLVGNRILPRMTTRTATAANATSISFPVGTSGIFIPTDVLSIIAPSVRLTITSGTGTEWAANDTITVTINGVATTYTVAAGDIGGSFTQTNTNIATKVINAIAANPYASRLVSGLSVSGTSPAMVIVFWAKDFTSLYSFAASKTGSGTVTASGAAFVPNVTIGTISAVNPDTDVVTISAAQVSVPLGMPIGVAASSPENLGLLSPELPIDLLYREGQNYALYLEAEVYGARLPYIDGQLTALYPAIYLV